MGDSHQQTQTQQSQSGTITPWEPAQGALNGILGGINGIAPNAGSLSGAQSSALNTIQGNAGILPNFTQQAQGLATNLANGGQNFQPMVSDAYSQYQKNMSPYADGQNLDPTKAPGMQSLIDTIRNDVSNSVNGQFAGAGRDLSGLNQQSLARGIAQGEAAPLLGQYNQNVQNQFAANTGILGGAQSTANTNSGLQQTQFGNQIAGVTNGANMVGQAANAAPNAQLAAMAQAYGIPIQQLAQLAGLTVPIAGLGKQYTGTGSGTSNTTNSPSMLSQIGQGVGIFSGLFG